MFSYSGVSGCLIIEIASAPTLGIETGLNNDGLPAFDAQSATPACPNRPLR